MFFRLANISWVVFVCVFFLCGCRTQDNDTSPYELAIYLLWGSTDDLDLQVIDAKGELIYFANPRSASSGKYVSDVNADCEFRIREKAEEAVVWLIGAIVTGTYQITVTHYNNCDNYPTTAFWVNVIQSGSMTKTYAGSVDTTVSSQQTYTLTVVSQEKK